MVKSTRFIEKAREWTGCDNKDIEIVKTSFNNDACIALCKTIEDSTCHVWVLRIWKSFVGSILLSVDYEKEFPAGQACEMFGPLSRAVAGAVSYI